MIKSFLEELRKFLYHLKFWITTAWTLKYIRTKNWIAQNFWTLSIRLPPQTFAASEINCLYLIRTIQGHCFRIAFRPFKILPKGFRLETPQVSSASKKLPFFHFFISDVWIEILFTSTLSVFEISINTTLIIRTWQVFRFIVNILLYLNLTGEEKNW